MKISLKWLNDFVSIEDFYKKPKDLADLLTKVGLEVEEIVDRGASLDFVVIGHIKTKDKHPNSDKLSLCQVETVSGRIDQIICGAQNHKAGDKVVVALPGAVLPGNFSIKISKIRDVESMGMLCSDQELGLVDTSDGIRILSSEAPVGKLFSEVFGLDDITMELKVTPNRADCLSHYGLARELACVLNRPIKKLSPSVNLSPIGNDHKSVSVKVENSDLCIRYSGRTITGVKIGPSPGWLKDRLESVGQSSINNVVDVTNYVMLELGQPLHAFDRDQLFESKIQVRVSKKAEKLVTLTNTELSLKGDELLIGDGEKPLALAGVIGGLHSGVSDLTKNLFIESANFNAMAARRASRSHGIETDSAYRFSRGVDPELAILALNRASELIQKAAGGICVQDITDIYPQPIKKNPIHISIQTVTDRMGYLADEILFEQYMNGLQCSVEKKPKGEFIITPPTFRFDLNTDIDLVEEYARLKGYEFIQETIPAFSKMPSQHDQNYLNEFKVAKILLSEGISEAFNYAFVSREKEEKWIEHGKNWNDFGLSTSDDSIKILNPLNEEINVMRRTLSFQMMQNVISNFHLGNASGALFSIGSVFSKKDSNYLEERRLCVALWGEPIGLFADGAPLVMSLASRLTQVFREFGLHRFSFLKTELALPFLHLGQLSQIQVEGKKVGFVGSINPGLLMHEKIRVPVALCEISLSILIPSIRRPKKIRPLPISQPAIRDFAFLINQDISVGDMIRDIEKTVGIYLIKVIVFDLYEGDKVPTGMKSVAFRLSLSGGDTAITESQAKEISDKVVQVCLNSHKAQLRS